MKSRVETAPSMPSRLSDLMYVDRSLAVACTRGREAVVSRFRELLHREDFSEQQWRVLRILTDLGEMTSVEISTRSCIHKVSISRIIRSLEKRDLVSRRVSESDARASYVKLTDLGKIRMQPLVEESTTIHLQIAAEFGVDRYEQLLHLLCQLADINRDTESNTT